MRIGAIFARGSCRALKWMALFGVVFALGAAQAAAQVTVKTPETVDEAGRLTLSISAKIEVPTTVTDAGNLVVTVTIDDREDGDNALTDAEKAAGLTDAEEEDFDGDGSETLTLVVQPHQGTTTTNNKRELEGTIVIQTRPDLDAEDEGLHLSYAVTVPGDVVAQGGATITDVDADSDDKKVTINDTDDQLFEWEVTTTSPSEGDSDGIDVTLTADPAPVDRLHVTAISVDKAGYTLDTSSHTFGANANVDGDDGPMATIEITPPNPDGDRDMDTITLRAVMGGTNVDRATPLEIEVADVHGLPMADKITAKAFMIDEDDKKTEDEAMSIMEGGDPVYVTVTVDRGEKGYPSGEALKVAVTADRSQALDYRVDPAEITIASGTGKKSADFMLWASANDDVGMEDLMLHLTAKGATAKNGSGDVMSMFSIAIEDATTPLVSVKEGAYDAIMMELGEDPLNPGDEVMIMTDDLFVYDDDMVSVSFGASVEGAAASASASGEAVTVTAMEPGEGKVTVTATATPMSSSLIITQDRANVAQLTFPVSVVNTDLVLTVTADPMEIMEGGEAILTVTADREVEASDGRVQIRWTIVGDATIEDSQTTIAVGDTMARSAPVVSTDDDKHEEGETVTVAYSGTGIEGTQQLVITVIDNDDPPEPPAATVTAKSEAEVQAVFDSAVADARTGPDWVEGGAAAMVDMSMLFTVAEGAMPAYSGVSSDEMVVSASSSGMTLTLMPMSDGMATITVTAVDSASGDSDTASGMVTVADLPFKIDTVAASAAMVDEGMSITITATGNKMVEGDNVEVMLMRDGASTADDDDYSLDPPLITIMTGDMTGSLMLMATDDYDVEGMEKLTLAATMGGMNVGSVMIEIADNDMETTYTLSGPADMNIAEGMGAELTVTASQAVRMDTEVMIMRDGSSSAVAADFTAEPVMIMAGEMTGMTMVMAVEDGMMEDMEMLTVYGMVDGMNTNSVSFYLWDAAVPALPLIAQLLLAAFLAIGGYRRYLRR